MTKEGTKGTTSDRRGFLKTAAIGAGVGAAALLGVESAQASAPVGHWDQEADVVVLGFGGAGAAAAIEAHDAGSKAIILEKMPGAGGSTAMSEGAINLPKLPLNLEAAADYAVALGRGRVAREYALAWLEEAAQLPGFLNGKLGGDGVVLDLTLTYHPSYSGSSQATFFMQRSGGSGAGLFKLLSDGVKFRGIPVLFETPATRLLKDGNGEVIGVLAEGENGKLNIKARKGVVLATGGFNYDEELKLSNLRLNPVYGVCNPGNTGDAIKLAAAFGAQLWKMPEDDGGICFRVPGLKVAVPSGFQIDPRFFVNAVGMVLVNRHGRRFTNEAAEYDTHYRALSSFDTVLDEYSNVPCWYVFDEETRKIGPVGRNKSWSADNSSEIEKGLIVKGETIAELGQKAGIDPTTLDETVKTFNSYCAAGHDPEFRRESRQKLKPLASVGPYYAIQGWPGSFGTMGGPKVNTKSQIVDVYNKVIPRLYAAGDASMVAMGFYYQGGSGLSNALSFGRIAGRNVAAESTRRIS